MCTNQGDVKGEDKESLKGKERDGMTIKRMDKRKVTERKGDVTHATKRDIWLETVEREAEMMIETAETETTTETGKEKTIGTGETGGQERKEGRSMRRMMTLMGHD